MNQLETNIRFRITCIQVYLSYIETINHFKIKYRLGLLYGELDNCLDLLEEGDGINFTEIIKKIDLVEIFLRQL